MHYHATFIWPMNIPGSTDEIKYIPVAQYSAALRLVPLFGPSLILFSLGTAFASVGSLFGLLFVRTSSKYTHAWIGLLGGACLSISAWFLLGIETSIAWSRFEHKIFGDNNAASRPRNVKITEAQVHASDLSAPLISYSVLVILSTAIISRNLLRIDMNEYFSVKPTEAGNSLWVVQTLIMVAVFFFQMYYPFMLLGGHVVGLVALGFVPVCLLAAYGIGRGISCRSTTCKIPANMNSSRSANGPSDNPQESLLQA